VKMERIDEGTEIPRATVKIQIRHGRRKILDEIRELAQQRLAAGAAEDGAMRGIELVDLGISQIQFVESVRSKTFDRWIAEREAISAANVNEGERRKQEIINRAAAQVERIQGEGQQRANELRGNVDAEIIRKYAEAIEEAGEFFTFIRTLEAYTKVIRPDTHLILTTDTELFRLLKRLDEPPLVTDQPQ
jgi:modulator of FtsH protease HflC